MLHWVEKNAGWNFLRSTLNTIIASSGHEDSGGHELSLYERRDRSFWLP